jgi:hypothetical protein
MVHLPRLCAQHRAHALRSDLHDAAVALRRFHHIEALFRAVRHRLLAVDVLTRIACIHHDAFMPVIRHSRNDAVDVLAIQQLLIMPGYGQIRIFRDLPSKRMTAVVEIGSTHALDSRQPDRGPQQP